MKELIVDLSKMSISDADGMPLGMLSVTAGDLEPVIIKTTGTLTGYSPVIAIKTSALSSDLLALADNLTNNSGVWSGVLNFNTANLRTAMDGLENLDAILELVWKKSTGEQRTCAHISLQIKADIYRGNEGTPADLPTNLNQLIDQAVADYLEANPPTGVSGIKPYVTQIECVKGINTFNPPNGYMFVPGPFTVSTIHSQWLSFHDEFEWSTFSGASSGLDKNIHHGIFTKAKTNGLLVFTSSEAGPATINIMVEPIS